MQPFLSAMLKSGKTPEEDAKQNPAAQAGQECNGCGGNATVAAKSGMEGTDISKLEGAKAEGNAGSYIDNDGKTTIIGKGPLGALMTGALNKQFQRQNVHVNVDIGTESLAGVDVARVNANGQVLASTDKQSQSVARSRMITGVLPPIGDDENVTCLNAVLQALGMVRNVDFIFVSDSPLGKELTQQTGTLSPVKAIPFDNGKPGSIGIESVEIVVRYKEK